MSTKPKKPKQPAPATRRRPRQPRAITRAIHAMRYGVAQIETSLDITAGRIDGLSLRKLRELAGFMGDEADALDRYHGGSANLDPSQRAKRKGRGGQPANA